MKLGYTLLYVDDVEKTMAFYSKAFGKPTKKPWGQVVSYVRDCNGLLVEICSSMDEG